jgi:hypothetical protein
MKRYLSIVTATTLALGLTACGGGGGGGTTPASQPTDENTNQTPAETQAVTVRVVDGYIIGASVKDALGNDAVELGNGLYKFENGVTYPIYTTHGKYLETGEDFDIAMIAYEGNVISPITTIAGNPQASQTLHEVFANALGTGNDTGALGEDYVDTNNTDFAKAAQFAYLLLKDGDFANFEAYMASQATPNSVNSLLEKAQNMYANEGNSIETTIKTNYIETLRNATVDTNQFESFIGNYKYNLSKVGDNDDYDGDGVSNKLEIIFGLDLTDPTDINGSADSDGDGVSNAREMKFAFEEACGNGYNALDSNYDSHCAYKYDEYNQYATGWVPQETDDGLIMSIRSDVADTFGAPYLSIADDAGSVVLKTYDEAQEYCQNLEFGGYNDWRLPTSDEARAIFGSSYQGMGNQYGVGYRYFNPFLHTEHIMNAGYKQHDGESFLVNAYKQTRTWIDQEYDADNAYAMNMWRYNLDLSFMGGSTYTPKSYTHNSICVRTYQ